MPKRQQQSALPTINTGKRNRPKYNPGMSRSRIAETRLTDESAYAFYKASSHRITAKTQNYQELKDDLVKYAELYGTPEQVRFFENMPLQRFRWMVENDLIIAEEMFVYDDSNYDLRGARIDKGRASELQVIIDRYNQLYRQGLDVRNARRRARDWA